MNLKVVQMNFSLQGLPKQLYYSGQVLHIIITGIAVGKYYVHVEVLHWANVLLMILMSNEIFQFVNPYAANLRERYRYYA